MLTAKDLRTSEELLQLVEETHFFASYNIDGGISLTPTLHSDGDSTWEDAETRTTAAAFDTVEECIAFLRGVQFLADALVTRRGKKGLPR